MFDEGDYTFDVSGSDRGQHKAVVSFSGGNEKLFYVDKTKPVVVENFKEFSNTAENSFRENKTAQIKITEHHFDPSLVGLKIFEKAAGADHTDLGFTDVTETFLKNIKWVDN